MAEGLWREISREGGILNVIPLVYIAHDMRGRSLPTAKEFTVRPGGDVSRPRMDGSRTASQLEASRFVKLSALRGQFSIATTAVFGGVLDYL